MDVKFAALDLRQSAAAKPRKNYFSDSTGHLRVQTWLVDAPSVVRILKTCMEGCFDEEIQEEQESTH